MIVCVEGPDRTGKSTQIKLLKSFFSKNKGILFHEVHCTADVAKDMDPEFALVTSTKYYEEMFQLARLALFDSLSLVFNRSHLGEVVYSKYRGYDGDYVFDLEDENLDVLEHMHLVVMVDSPENLVAREDGFSQSGQDPAAKAREVADFKRAFEETRIEKKLFVDVTEKDPFAVWREIAAFLCPRTQKETS
jgi:thymidylate kinase